MRTLRIVMIVLATMMVAFLLWNLTLNSDFQVKAEADVNTTSEEVFEHVNDLRNWEAWSQYLRRDTAMTITYSNPSAGERAWVRWKMQAGPSGRLEILTATPDSLQFSVSMPGLDAQTSTMVLSQKGEQTHITWSIKGKLPFYARFMKSGFENIWKNDLQKSLNTLTEEF